MKYNIGEIVFVKFGYTNDQSSNIYAGYGYKGGSTLVIREILGNNIDSNKNVYYFENHKNGIYEFALISLSENRDNKLKKLGIYL